MSAKSNKLKTRLKIAEQQLAKKAGLASAGGYATLARLVEYLGQELPKDWESRRFKNLIRAAKSELKQPIPTI